MRSIPVIVFINKLDREGRDPFALLDEVENELGIHTRPLTWPIGIGLRFQGVYNLFEKNLNLFSPSKTRISNDIIAINNLTDPQLDKHISADSAARLREEIGIIEGVYEHFNEDHYRDAYLAPVFFGSREKQISGKLNRPKVHSADLFLKFTQISIRIIETVLHSAVYVPASLSGINTIITRV